jgi:hypothetical protein
VAALLFLAIGLVCVVIGRILLISAAFGVSVWWGVGVFLPFGPLLFRLSYPELAPLSRKFRLAALPCLLAFFVLGPRLPSRAVIKHGQVPAAPAGHYGFERVGQAFGARSVEERRAANARELQRLDAWSEALRLKKRDLLHSDVEANRAYNEEVAQYNAALQKATAEKAALANGNR